MSVTDLSYHDVINSDITNVPLLYKIVKSIHSHPLVFCKFSTFNSCIITMVSTLDDSPAFISNNFSRSIVNHYLKELRNKNDLNRNVNKVLYTFDYKVNKGYWFIGDNLSSKEIFFLEQEYLKCCDKIDRFFILGDMEEQSGSCSKYLNSLRLLSTSFTGDPIDFVYKLNKVFHSDLLLYIEDDNYFIFQVPTTMDTGKENNYFYIEYKLIQQNMTIEFKWFDPHDKNNSADSVNLIVEKMIGKLNSFNILKDAREEIDLIDKSIIKLLDNRYKIVKQVGVIKNDYNIPIMQKKRVKSMMEEMEAYIKENTELSSEFVKALFHDIINYSMEVEK